MYYHMEQNAFIFKIIFKIQPNVLPYGTENAFIFKIIFKIQLFA